MTMTSVGDLSSALALRALNRDMKKRFLQLSQEVASGRVSDVAGHLRGDVGALGALNRELAMLQSYKLAGQEAAMRGQAIQDALGIIQNQTVTLGTSFLSDGKSGTLSSVKAAGQAALSGLETVVSALNARRGGLGLFSGQATRGPTVISAGKMLDDLEARVANASTLQDITRIVESYFQDPSGGFQTNGYQGSTQPSGPVRLSDTETESFDVTALSPEIRTTLQGLALAALTTRNIPTNDITSRSSLVYQAGSLLVGANDGIISLQAQIGTTQARIDEIQTRQMARMTAAEIDRNALVSADPYDSATRLQGIQNSLQALYMVTSRVAGMSLVGFLK